MYLWLENWSQKDRRQEYEEKGSRTLNPYWRMCFRHYFLIASNTGCRPSELIERLRWSDIEVEELSPGRIIAIVLIRKTKTGNKREIVSNAGDYFLRWKKWIDEYRRKNQFRPINKNDLVFCNLKTDDAYTVTLFSRYFRKMRDDLGLSRNYTL
jgi:integrase